MEMSITLKHTFNQTSMFFPKTGVISSIRVRENARCGPEKNVSNHLEMNEIEKWCLLSKKKDRVFYQMPRHPEEFNDFELFWNVLYLNRDYLRIFSIKTKTEVKTEK